MARHYTIVDEDQFAGSAVRPGVVVRRGNVRPRIFVEPAHDLESAFQLVKRIFRYRGNDRKIRGCVNRILAEFDRRGFDKYEKFLDFIYWANNKGIGVWSIARKDLITQYLTHKEIRETF